MIKINSLREMSFSTLSLGSHPGILQAMLDYEYLSGKSSPSLQGIISTGRKYMRFFWGKKEVMIPLFPSLDALPADIKGKINTLLNNSSGRRSLSSTVEAIQKLPNLKLGVLFAENVPEKHSIELYHLSGQTDRTLIGPASIGIIVPSILKLGAIGGIQSEQFLESNLFASGSIAVFSSSGGMTNEILHTLATYQKPVSFSLAFGGDRFPLTTPAEAFMMAESDPETKSIIYFGELGGYDEYEIAELIEGKKITKTIYAYIAGNITEMFETPPQFGHAKAMAARGEETAKAKVEALKKVGVKATTSYKQFLTFIRSINSELKQHIPQQDLRERQNQIRYRKSALFVSSISADTGGDLIILGKPLTQTVADSSYSEIISSLLLGRKPRSNTFVNFVEICLKILVDHGPYVSGAVNTMISARAGKDLASALSSGLLTIGPRFGGAITQAADHWLKGVSQRTDPADFVEEAASQRKRISGIGHRKYSSDSPDPRVKDILSFANGTLRKRRHLQFAQKVEAITLNKKRNLILNVDGAIAATLLDILAEKEGYSLDKLQELIDIDFFNALFVIARSVGFTAHYLDQRRKDEGLFRLSPKEVVYFVEE